MGLSEKDNSHSRIRRVGQGLWRERKRDKRGPRYRTAEIVRRPGRCYSKAIVQLHGNQSWRLFAPSTLRRRSYRSDSRCVLSDRCASCRNRLLRAWNQRNPSSTWWSSLVAHPSVRDGSLKHLSEGCDQQIFKTKLHSWTRHGASSVQPQRSLQFSGVKRGEG